MAKFKCQLCNRIFANGRAFVGHMNAHQPNPLLPPKPIQKQQIGLDSAESSSSSSHSPCVEESEKKKKIEKWEVEPKPLVYGLRANPKKSIRIADPDFSSAVHPDLHLGNPTGRRSKRARKSSLWENREQNFNVNTSSVEFPAAGPEPLRPASGGAAPEVAQAAMMLMMMCRDQERGKGGEGSVELRQNNAKFQCQKCKKQFQSSRALAGHKKSCPMKGLQDKKSTFECPYCLRAFCSGQALGGHKRSHFMNSPKTDSFAATENSEKRGSNLIDLNFPSRSDDDELSGVCDA